VPYATNPDQLKEWDFVCAEHVGDDLYLRHVVTDWVNHHPGDCGTCEFCERVGMPVSELLPIFSEAVSKFFEDAEGTYARVEEDYLGSTLDARDVLWDLGIDESSPLCSRPRPASAATSGGCG